MKTRTDDRLGRLVLMTSHCAGMVDMVALPLWVGTLIARYGLEPRAAGGLVTIFLLGAVSASLVFAPRFDRHSGRRMAAFGFGIGALCFFIAAQIPPQTPQIVAMAALHGLGGLAAGCGLSFTHGTMGRSSNPHRLFGIAGAALGVFALAFLGLTPKLLEHFGGQALFLVLGGVMVIAALLAAWGFPIADRPAAASAATQVQGQRIPLVAWAGVIGVSCMALVQALVFSFVERMGMDRGFGLGAVTAILVGMGVVNLFPTALAALLNVICRLPASFVPARSCRPRWHSPSLPARHWFRLPRRHRCSLPSCCSPTLLPSVHSHGWIPRAAASRPLQQW